MFKKSMLAVVLLLGACGPGSAEPQQTGTGASPPAPAEQSRAGDVCDTCSSDADCGGNLRCGTSAVCVTTCDASGGCPESFACDETTGQCLPEAGACDGETPPAQPTTTPPTETPPTTREPAPAEPAPAPAPSVPKCTEDTWDSYVGAQMMDRCERCHSFARTLSGVQKNADDIAGKIDVGTSGKHKVPQADYDRIMKWISCGAEQSAQ